MKISLVSKKRLFVKRSINATSIQFEELISSKIEETKDIPEVISETGKIGMPHKGSCLFEINNHHNDQFILQEIMQKIGQLFLLRTNINSVGSVLDSPVRNFFHLHNLELIHIPLAPCRKFFG